MRYIFRLAFVFLDCLKNNYDIVARFFLNDIKVLEKEGVEYKELKTVAKCNYFVAGVSSLAGAATGVVAVGATTFVVSTMLSTTEV